MAFVTNTPLTLAYFIRDIAGALITFDRLRWYQSRDGENGVFGQATAAAPTAAILISSFITPHQLFGKTLSFIVNAVQVDVTFATADPVSSAAAAAEINTATALVVADDPGDGTLRLTSANTGSDTAIEIVAAADPDTDAASFLGWMVGDGAQGQDIDTVLLTGIHEYFFTDGHSGGDYWYKIRTLHSSSGQQSELSSPFPANSADQVPRSQTIVAFIRLADISGFPIEGRKVTLHNVFVPNLVAGFGIFRHTKTMVTDRNGYAEVRLVRGVDLDISIDGTGFVRRLAIPTTGDIVDLLDPSLVIGDEFGVQEANIDFAIRTS